MNIDMRKSYLYFTILLFCFLYSSASTVYGCRTVPPSAQTLVSIADVVIRATAVKYIREPRGDIRALHTPNDVEIEFRVEEVLKGKSVPTSLILNGYLTDRDDYNDRPVSYDFVRKGGRGGSCFAYEYKQGAEFLLFLKKADGKYTLQLYALAPINEQLRNKDDEWLIWVKNQLQTLKADKQK
jgi:hypothetical protein